MANVRSDLVFKLKEKGIERGFRCEQTPPGNYFEKKGSAWVDLKVKTVEGVFELKGWKIPEAPEKKAAVKKPAAKKAAKKAVKKNAKPKMPKKQSEVQQPGEPANGEE